MNFIYQKIIGKKRLDKKWKLYKEAFPYHGQTYIGRCKYYKRPKCKISLYKDVLYLNEGQRE
jgi:hypothetical protein